MRNFRLLPLIVVIFFLLLIVVPATADTTYTVQPGDTLALLARRYGTTVTAIAQTNHIINPNLIYVGQTLIIPDGSSVNPPGPTPTPPPSTSPPPTGETITYVVQSGDTMFRIGVRFNVTVSALALANGITNMNLIYVGQTLVIPGSGGTPPPPPAVSPTPPPSPQPTTPAPIPPTLTPVPPAPPPVSGANLLPNWSFEDGWYNLHGIPELQLPNGWSFEWDEGDNPFGDEPWSDWVRPETRVLSREFLPPSEQTQLIWDGNHTVKMFKGSGAISFRLLTDVYLQPGTYILEINVFPDLVMEYDGGQKIWATDPVAGEVRFIVGGGGSGWFSPEFGQRNTLTHSFTITSSQTVRVGAAMRGRYALPNNGWFMDAWSLRKQ